ncbi:hypothetical protein BJX65DRAFT_62911 [Aspergillus insuetus]
MMPTSNKRLLMLEYTLGITRDFVIGARGIGMLLWPGWREEESRSLGWMRTPLMILCKKTMTSRSEKTVMSTVFPIIRGSADIPFREEKLFGNLDSLAEHLLTGRVPDTPPSAFVSWCNG